MASNIPTRRVTRAARAVIKEDENANARITSKITSRPKIATRSKPPSTTSASTTMKTRASAHADANTTQKRKREALGELTGKAVNNRMKLTTADTKGKGKEITAEVKPTKPPSKSAISSVVKTTTVSTVKAATARVPLRTVTTRSKANVTESAVSLTTTRHAVSRTSSSVVAGVAARRSIHVARAPIDTDDEMTEPSSKRRRTSSEDDERAVLEGIEEEKEETSEVEDTAPKPGKAKSDFVKTETKPEPVQDWDDLDREDDDDPNMVSEYVVDIFNYLKEVEQATMPNPNYMENQKELAWKMRGILMDWLIQVHSRFKLLPETLFLCTNLVDRFLSARVVSLAKLQLVGVSCMFIAAKLEETIAPSVTNFIYCADSTYTEQEILQAEKYILKTVDWNLSYPSPLNFLRRISKADDYNVHARTVGKYLVEIGCLEYRLLAAPPSLLAAAAMWLARLILNNPDWTPNLRHYSAYAEEALIPTANIILNYVLREKPPHESFFKKYASKKFMKASVFVRQWALELWEENSIVDLAKDLPALKAEARQRVADLTRSGDSS